VVEVAQVSVVLLHGTLAEWAAELWILRGFDLEF
jgi:hypothetical protein